MPKPQDSPQQDPEPEFSLLRSFKLGSFHIGSSLTDLLTSAVWNRILIVDLGVAAWPVALLTALRYLMSPLTLWIGHLSDTHPIAGSRRIAYVWLGRLLMLASLPLLPLSMAAIGFDTRSQTGWSIAVFSFLLYGIGTLISGAPYLALVHDSAPYQRRGQVMAIVQTFLVASFAFGGYLYGKILPTWNYQRFWFLVVFAMVGAAFFWFFLCFGRRAPAASHKFRSSRPLFPRDLFQYSPGQAACPLRCLPGRFSFFRLYARFHAGALWRGCLPHGCGSKPHASMPTGGPASSSR